MERLFKNDNYQCYPLLTGCVKTNGCIAGVACYHASTNMSFAWANTGFVSLTNQRKSVHCHQNSVTHLQENGSAAPQPLNEGLSCPDFSTLYRCSRTKHSQRIVTSAFERKVVLLDAERRNFNAVQDQSKRGKVGSRPNHSPARYKQHTMDTLLS